MDDEYDEAAEQGCDCAGCNVRRRKQTIEHPWLSDLRIMVALLEGNLELPHHTTQCTECYKALELHHRAFIEQRKQARIERLTEMNAKVRYVAR